MVPTYAFVEAKKTEIFGPTLDPVLLILIGIHSLNPVAIREHEI
jgi:hypothetical protein